MSGGFNGFLATMPGGFNGFLAAMLGGFNGLSPPTTSPVDLGVGLSAAWLFKLGVWLLLASRCGACAGPPNAKRKTQRKRQIYFFRGGFFTVARIQSILRGYGAREAGTR